jgi:hypothetical protein
VLDILADPLVSDADAGSAWPAADRTRVHGPNVVTSTHDVVPLSLSLLDLDGLIVCSTCDDRFWMGSGHAEL